MFEYKYFGQVGTFLESKNIFWKDILWKLWAFLESGDILEK